MASGIIQAPICHVKNKNFELGFVKDVDFVKISNVKRVHKSPRSKFCINNSSNPGSDIAELQPASEGSSLLGKVIRLFDNSVC